MKIKIIDMLSKMNSDCNYRPNINFHGSNYTYKKDYDDYINDTGHLGILSGYSINMILDDEVEILDEQNKIEKLDVALLGQCDNWLQNPITEFTLKNIEINPYIIDNIRENTLNFQYKLNEVIDKVNSLDKEDK